MRSYMLILFLTMLTSNCNSQPKQNNSVRGFDISKDDSHILFSLVQEGNTTIHEMSIDGSEDKILVEANNDKFYVNPKYSPDGKHIVFIEYDKKDLQSSKICIISINGKSTRYLLQDEGIVTEAIFSKYRNETIFLKAKEYDSYSPIGVKSTHDYDIYSINLSDGNTKQLSNLNAYSINHIFEVDSSYLLIFKYSGPDGGMFLFNKNTPEEDRRIVPENDPRGDASMYKFPIYNINTNTLAFIAPYQLYLMNMESKTATLLYDNKGHSHIDYITFFNKKEKIMFVKKGELSFYTINLDGSGLKRIPI